MIKTIRNWKFDLHKYLVKHAWIQHVIFLDDKICIYSKIYDRINRSLLISCIMLLPKSSINDIILFLVSPTLPVFSDSLDHTINSYPHHIHCQSPVTYSPPIINTKLPKYFNCNVFGSLEQDSFDSEIYTDTHCMG